MLLIAISLVAKKVTVIAIGLAVKKHLVIVILNDKKVVEPISAMHA